MKNKFFKKYVHTKEKGELANAHEKLISEM
jgi:hypothetical protein